MDLVKGAFHPEKFSGCNDATLSPVFDFEILIEMIGIPNAAALNALQLTILHSAGFNNATSVLLSEPLPGEEAAEGAPVKRLIVYDPEWVKAAPAEAYLVLGHEAGHHFCGHDLNTLDPSLIPEKELEADRFSGAAIKRFETYHGRAFLNDALEAAARLYPAEGSHSHPPRAERVKAILLGYNSGSPCSNLAPGIPGYNPEPR
jgi:Zn-dependent protease with chaperone function